MFDHLGLRVRDLAASARFYRAVLAPLGYVVEGSGSGFGPPGAAALWLYETKEAQVGGTHVALRARSRASVERFHREGIAAGARDDGRPGLRSDYGATYYAAFLLDPDGNNIEAVCLDEER